MRKLMFALFLFIGLNLNAQCVIETGNLIIENLGNHRYNMYLSQMPINTCFPPVDSSSLWIGATNSTGTMVTSKWLKSTDTLQVEAYGHVILAAKIKWYKNGIPKSETHIWVNDIYALGTFSYTIIDVLSVPDTIPPTITPPVFVPEFNINNGMINSNVGGTLIIMSYPNFDNIIVKEYDNQFIYNLLPGWWYCYLILDDGTTLGNIIIQN